MIVAILELIRSLPNLPRTVEGEAWLPLLTYLKRSLSSKLLGSRLDRFCNCSERSRLRERLYSIIKDLRKSVVPTVLKVESYRFFFFSREETRIHIHVSCSDGEAKFWLLVKKRKLQNFFRLGGWIPRGVGILGSRKLFGGKGSGTWLQDQHPVAH